MAAEGLRHFESERRNSFRAWPADLPVSPDALAAAGFYAVGADVVRCFCCDVAVLPDSWSQGDNAMEVHRRLSKSCDFACGRNTHNVSLLEENSAVSEAVGARQQEVYDEDDFGDDEDDDGVNPDFSQQPIDYFVGPAVVPTSSCFPQQEPHQQPHPPPDLGDDFVLDDDIVDVMADRDMRLATFCGSWPQNCLVSPAELAGAGFYYIGPGDRVRCCCCSGCVENWEHGDCALTEHRRLFPHCSFVRGAFVRSSSPGAGNELHSAHPLVDRHENSPRMNEEAARLATFADWPAPARQILLPGALARAGFYYTGTGDTVRCAFCRVCIRHWEPGDLAFRRHRRESPACSLVLGTCTSNVTLEDVPQYEREEDPAKDMHFEALRLATFSTWPAQLAISASELASAGFYYAGVGDVVRCFACGGTLNDWEPGQMAQQRHAECFPDCLFVQNTGHNNVPVPGPPPLPEPELLQMRLEKVRAQSFASWPRHAAVTSEELVEAGFYYTCQGDIVRCFHCDVELCHWKTWHTAWGRHREASPNCLYVRQSCPADPVAYAAMFYRHHADGGTLLPACSPLLDAAFQRSRAELDVSGLSLEMSTSPYRHPPAPVLEPQYSLAATLPGRPLQRMVGPVTRSESVPALNTDLPKTTDELQNELQQLRESHLCKICMERERTHAFFPCGHTICCGVCASTVKLCPVCRQPFDDTLRVFVL